MSLIARIPSPRLGSLRIDTHHHVVPSFYRDWLAARGVDAGGMPIPQWSAQASLDLMARTRTGTAILSVSTPGVQPADGAEAASVARDLNAFCHQVVQDHPGRFGYFATLTLPNVDRAITEMHHAVDELGADGVVLLANAKGTYLGDPLFDPLMAELDARAATVFIHPGDLPGGSVPGIPSYEADFLLDTTRAALNLARHGVLERFPQIRFILSHGGGTIPFAALRLAPGASPTGNALDGLRTLRRFYYDTALTPSPLSMPALLRFVPRRHILFGSDFPYAPKEASVLFARILTAYPTISRRAIDRGNAERLFPRLAA
jgi:predicted TIM-barrel fold metal-dependent hydrolase